MSRAATIRTAPALTGETPVRSLRGIRWASSADWRRNSGISAPQPRLDRGLVVGGALVAGHVADHRLPRRVGLVGRLALARLAGRGGVGIRVVVQVVGLRLRTAAVGGRRGGTALVVGPGRRDHDDGPLPGPVGVALAAEAGHVAEPQRGVVAR